MEKDLMILQSKLQYVFLDINLLKIALTHKSYAYEYTKEARVEYNERIEFLGDAILEHSISDLLYKNDKYFSEGEMSKLRAKIVCEASLARAMKEIGAHKFIRLGKCEMVTGGQEKDAIIADAFEAIIGAIYLDSNYDIANQTILRLLDKEIKEILNGNDFNKDYKTAIQEELQKNGSVKIEYKLISEQGPEHDKTFLVHLYYNNKKIGEGNGKSKKQAEQHAAKNALEIKNWD